MTSETVRRSASLHSLTANSYWTTRTRTLSSCVDHSTRNLRVIWSRWVQGGSDNWDTVNGRTVITAGWLCWRWDAADREFSDARPSVRALTRVRSALVLATCLCVYAISLFTRRVRCAVDTRLGSRHGNYSVFDTVGCRLNDRFSTRTAVFLIFVDQNEEIGIKD